MVSVELPRRNRGIQGTHAEYGRGRGLVKLWHPLNFHRTRTGQIQGLQGAVDSVQGRILQGQVKADISAVYLISKWDIRIFSLIYLRYFDIIDKCKIYMGDLFLKRDKHGISTRYSRKKQKLFLSETDPAEKI